MTTPHRPATEAPTPLLPKPRSLVLSDAEGLLLTAASRVAGASPELRALVADDLARVTGLGVAATDDIAADIVLERTGSAEESADESYALTVAEDGVRIVAAAERGLFLGSRTLLQLAAGAATPDGVRLPALAIEDAPRFAYRGAMLDVARHFFEVDVVLRLVEDLAALKINHLHLHLSDDQGWRIEVPGYPELTRTGATCEVGGGRGGFYTDADYERIVAHAASRFVTIVPEIDMPGHTNAALVSYPELAPADVVPAPYTGTEVGFSTFAIGVNAVDGFVDAVLAHVASITPGPYLHIGGDESLSTADDDFRAFIARATRVVAENGKTPVGWHEIGRSADLAPGTIGQYWGHLSPRDDMDERARSIVEQGGRLILSPCDAAYLDIRPTPDFPLGLAWSTPSLPLEQAYDWEPADVVPGVPEDRLLGIEAALWTETLSTEEHLRTMLFPRLLAIAERAWVTDADDVATFTARVRALEELAGAEEDDRAA